METILTILFFLLFGGSLLYISSHTWYMRYMYDYEPQIADYLATHKLQLLEIRFPRNVDWKTSPFKKPPIVKISIVRIRFLGSSSGVNEDEYKILWVQNRKNKYEAIWLKIFYPFLSKPELTFKKETKKRAVENVLYQNNVVEVHATCPACSAALKKEDKECPECGLCFG